MTPDSGVSASLSIGVIVVNAGDGRFLARVFDALDGQTLPPAGIFLVDNASGSEAVEDVARRRADVHVIRLEKNAGFAAANNVAIRAAEHCEWIALLNPDAFPERDWLARLAVAAREEPGYDFFASRLVRDDAPEVIDSAGDAYHVSGVPWQRGRGRPAAQYDARERVFGPSAAAALYRRAALLAVGGFDERLFCYLEDVDLAFRLRLAGSRCLYVPDAVVRHVGSGIVGRESDFMAYHTHRNVVWVFAKDMPSPLIWLYLPQHLLVNVLTLLAFAAQGRLGVVARAKRDALRGLPAVWRDRRAVQATRRVGVKSLRQALATGVGVLPVLLRRSRELRAGRRPARATGG